ncbi:MAG: DUF4410 domain-containing protein [Deltaproteobacteria bacterium]|jgi:hypothetical protein|nr:DUF4410 domain-containing protein [Deltaproteobacteria bacterium]MBW2542775.1 DUF4410 domain-containing protein [Deltaproteobacteria bacterium]
MVTNQHARRTATALAWISISVLIAIAMGCASARVTSTPEPGDPGMLPRPSVIYIYDFAVSPNDVVIDTLGAEFTSESEELTKEKKQAYATADALSKAIVEQLQKQGINAQRAKDGDIPPLNALVLKGQFITIDKGSRFKRMVIGFGAGSSELRANVQAYQATARGLHPIAEAVAEAKGSKAPGMAIPVAGGAAMGSAATSAIVSGGLNVARETRAAMSPDVKRMAEKIAERAKAFYVRQGWL